MDEKVLLSDSEKWHAVTSCDRSFDGLFLYGVKTTGIFCRPSCKAKSPVRENVLYFDNCTEAIKAGFRPCKKCRPDKEVFEPERELVSKAKIIFDKEYDGITDINSTAKQLGVSTNHLARLFKKQLGLTPAQYIAGLRISKAAELLERTEKDILEIAYMTGFKSLSSFYKRFREKTGHTPKEHRRTGGGKNAGTLL